MGVQRFIVTLMMWVAFMVVLGLFFAAAAAPTSNIDGNVIVGVVLAVSAAVGVSTVAIWRMPGSVAAGGVEPARSARPVKSKREQASRLQDLIQNLDEDEIIELETMLESRDVAPRSRLH